MEQEQRIATLERLLLAAHRVGATGGQQRSGAAMLAALRRISIRWRSATVARALDGWSAAAAAGADLVADIEASVGISTDFA